MRPYSIFQEQKLLVPLLYTQNEVTSIQQPLVVTRSSFKKSLLPVQNSISKNPYSNILKKAQLAKNCNRESFPGFFTYSQETTLHNSKPSKSVRLGLSFLKASRFKNWPEKTLPNQETCEKIKALQFCLDDKTSILQSCGPNPSLKVASSNDVALLVRLEQVSINSPDTSYSKLLLLIKLADIEEKRSSFKDSVAQMVLDFNSFEIKDLNYAYNLFQVFLINLTNRLTAYNYFGSDALSHQKYAVTKSQNKSSIVDLLRLVRTLNEPSKVTDVPLSTQLYTVIRSPHVFKKTREQFAVTQYKRTLKLNFKSKTALRLLLNSLILLKLPVETKIKIKHF